MSLVVSSWYTWDCKDSRSSALQLKALSQRVLSPGDRWRWLKASTRCRDREGLTECVEMCRQHNIVEMNSIMVEKGEGVNEEWCGSSNDPWGTPCVRGGLQQNNSWCGTPCPVLHFKSSIFVYSCNEEERKLNCLLRTTTPHDLWWIDYALTLTIMDMLFILNKNAD